MGISHTDARIKKLWSKGLTIASISNKIGRPGDSRRVLRALPQGVRHEREECILAGQRAGLLASQAARAFDEKVVDRV